MDEFKIDYSSVVTIVILNSLHLPKRYGVTDGVRKLSCVSLMRSVINKVGNGKDIF